jgi:hypothetical protein
MPAGAQHATVHEVRKAQLVLVLASVRIQNMPPYLVVSCVLLLTGLINTWICYFLASWCVCPAGAIGSGPNSGCAPYTLEIRDDCVATFRDCKVGLFVPILIGAGMAVSRSQSTCDASQLGRRLCPSDLLLPIRNRLLSSSLVLL